MIYKFKEKLIHLPELLLIYFAPAGGQLAVIGLAILADSATGIWAARKKGELISSKKLSQAFPKMVVYLLLILLAHGIEKEFQINIGVSIRSLVALAILGNELMSIDENLKKATGRGMFQKLISVIRRK